MADDSWQDLWALARKRAEWELMGVCMSAYTVYRFRLFYALPVDNQFFFLSLVVILDRLGPGRVLTAHPPRDR